MDHSVEQQSQLRLCGSLSRTTVSVETVVLLSENTVSTETVVLLSDPHSLN